jgi:hypothetical protein
MTDARQTIAVMITFRKCIKNSPERRVGACRWSRKETPYTTQSLEDCGKRGRDIARVSKVKIIANFCSLTLVGAKWGWRNGGGGWALIEGWLYTWYTAVNLVPRYKCLITNIQPSVDTVLFHAAPSGKSADQYSPNVFPIQVIGK